MEFPCADERLPKMADFLAEMTLQSAEFTAVPVATVVRNRTLQSFECRYALRSKTLNIVLDYGVLSLLPLSLPFYPIMQKAAAVLIYSRYALEIAPAVPPNFKVSLCSLHCADTAVLSLSSPSS